MGKLRYIALDQKSQKKTKKRAQKREIAQKRKKILKKGKCPSKKCSKKGVYSKKNSKK